MSFFESLDLLPDDPILSIPAICEADKNPRKVDLSIGIYRNEYGQVPVFKAIAHAEELVAKQHADKVYQAIDGNGEYIKQVLQLIFGEKAPVDEIYAAQTIGGSGALRLAGEFLKRTVSADIFVTEPTWPNHKLIFSQAGLNVLTFPYFDKKTRTLEFDKICQSIGAMPSKSLILFQASCHNPTGVDPTHAQWLELSKLILKKNLMPIFDFPYQGFGVDFESDAAAIRHFQAEGHNMAVTYSFSKNMGLYGERIGLLAIVEPNARIRKHIASHIKQLIRSNYSTPPLYGGRLVTTVLTNPPLKQQWLQELEALRLRLVQMRTALMQGLSQGGDDFSFLTGQKGLFSFLGLTPKQVLRLQTEFAIYLPNMGRINIANLNARNIDYVIKALSTILKA